MGRDVFCCRRDTAILWFQSTRPHGPRLELFQRIKDWKLFQSTRPHGPRPASGEMFSSIGMFQSTRPHGPRLHTLRHKPNNLSFNPRGRMGRDWACPRLTRWKAGFQSTRPHGPRLFSVSSSSSGARFQSTRPHGPRHGFLNHGGMICGVSIHAAAWAATRQPG